MFSSLIGLFQQDIKKVIAYSTMSQLAREYTSHSSIFRHQTICAEAINIIIIIANSQITKARDYFQNNHYNFKFFNSSTIIGLFRHLMSVPRRRISLPPPSLSRGALARPYKIEGGGDLGENLRFSVS